MNVIVVIPILLIRHQNSMRLSSPIIFKISRLDTFSVYIVLSTCIYSDFYVVWSQSFNCQEIILNSLPYKRLDIIEKALVIYLEFSLGIFLSPKILFFILLLCLVATFSLLYSFINTLKWLYCRLKYLHILFR